MGKARIVLRYTGAVAIFVIGYAICSIIAHIAVGFANLDAQGIWINLLPYFSAVVAGIAGVYGGLYTVDRWLPSVRPRTVAWAFISFMSFVWGLPILGLIMGLVGIIDSPLQSHVLLSTDNQTQAVQALVAVIAAWKLTAHGEEFDESK